MVIDSHTLMWWLEDSDELSQVARDVLHGAEQRGERHRVCAVTFWELRWKEVRGQLEGQQCPFPLFAGGMNPAVR